MVSQADYYFFTGTARRVFGGGIPPAESILPITPPTDGTAALARGFKGDRAARGTDVLKSLVVFALEILEGGKGSPVIRLRAFGRVGRGSGELGRSASAVFIAFP